MNMDQPVPLVLRNNSKLTSADFHVIRKIGSTQRIALLSREDRAAATVNMHGKFAEIWTCSFLDKRADRQTNK